MKAAKHLFQIVLLFTAIFCLQSCNHRETMYIVIGDHATQTELLTVGHLKKDLENSTGKLFSVINAKDDLPAKGLFYIVGTSVSNKIIRDLVEKKTIVLSDRFPGNRGGIWAKVKLKNNQESIVLAGSDVQGTQYAIYEYCQEVLGIDPFEYWTGKLPDPNRAFEPFNFTNRVIAPPEIPILCYFENDVDELANLKPPMLEYDWESYSELINSLVRIKYNAIQLFDMLGRPEFFLRDEYKNIRSNYDIRISYIDSMINYAHDMGMMVQIDLSLGYKIKPMAQKKADCWHEYKDDWKTTWRYYFEKTPVGKADIFALRPRNQVWDWEYKSSCGEDKIEVFNEVYAELGNLIDEYKPGAKKVVICYADGMEMFNKGFNPPKDWTIAWSDNGWGEFKHLPKSTKGYDFGTYMHAGYWLNHTVHDPCPVKLDTVIKNIIKNYQANKYCLVNGQQFRPFLLNIEAFSAISENPEIFDGKQFYEEWAQRYFGDKASGFAVEAMKKLHEAQFDNVGYVKHLWEIQEAASYLSDAPIERPGKEKVPCDYARVENDYEHVVKRIEILNQALDVAENGAKFISEDNTFYHDYILLPIHLYLDLVTFENCLHEMAELKKVFEKSGNKKLLKQAIVLLERAREDLNQILQRSLQGDKNKKWTGWYDPSKRRPNNGFPSMEMLDAIETNLKSKL